MIELESFGCVPCSVGAAPLGDDEIDQLLAAVPEWKVVEKGGVRRLVRKFELKSFRDALELTNKVGELAEVEDHHPKIITEWGKVEIHWWTHKIGGLHKNDFIMAAKTDGLAS